MKFECIYDHHLLAVSCVLACHRLLFGLKSEEDFYVRYYTIQLLTALLTNSLKRCPVSSFLSCWDAVTTFESHVTLFLSVFQITGGNSIDSSWYNSHNGHAYGS
jgi:hypothetical protein